MNRALRLLLALILILVMVGCGRLLPSAPATTDPPAAEETDESQTDDSQSEDDSASGPSVISVSIAGDTEVAVGETLELSATVQVSPSDVSSSVTWSVSPSDGSIATVSDSGVVTGVAAGAAEVTATSVVDATKSGSISITVTGGSSVNIPQTATMTENPGSQVYQITDIKATKASASDPVKVQFVVEFAGVPKTLYFVDDGLFSLVMWECDLVTSTWKLVASETTSLGFSLTGARFESAGLTSNRISFSSFRVDDVPVLQNPPTSVGQACPAT